MMSWEALQNLTEGQWVHTVMNDVPPAVKNITMTRSKQRQLSFFPETYTIPVPREVHSGLVDILLGGKESLDVNSVGSIQEN